jgi:gas vesicle protein
MMDEQAHQCHDYRFLTGLVMGGVVGAGLAIFLAPRLTSEIRARAIDSAKSLGNAASEQYRRTKLRVTDAVDDLTRKGQEARDGVCDAVAHGAQEVERYATDVERYATDAKTHPVV